MTKTLQPTGFYDTLAPYAKEKLSVSMALANFFEDWGYERVDPPMVEYADTVFCENDLAESFRFLDPVSERMIALRSDITTQIGRIAATRLADQPAPLRIAYSGSVLRTKGESNDPARQKMQAGIECVGSDRLTADREVISIALKALQFIGVNDLCIDLTLPQLLRQVISDMALAEEEHQQLIYALKKRDIAAMGKINHEHIALLTACADPITDMSRLTALAETYPTLAEALTSLVAVVTKIQDAFPQVAFSVDLLDMHYASYYQGIAFSIFSTHAQSELGRGGRYFIHNLDGSKQHPAVGFTLYLDALYALLPKPAKKPKTLVPENISDEDVARLKQDGFSLIIAHSDDLAAEAKALGCVSVWDTKPTQEQD